jgi:hypothetical protein
MAQPIDKVDRWATLASPSPVDPPTAQKESGWVGGEQPEAEYENFLVQEIRDKTNEIIDQTNSNTLNRLDDTPLTEDPTSVNFFKGLRDSTETDFDVPNGGDNVVDTVVYIDSNDVKKIITMSYLGELEQIDTRTLVRDWNQTINMVGLPTGTGENWNATSMCTDGTYLYVLWYDTNPVGKSHRVQSYLISDRSVNTSWPGTGLLLTGTGQSVLQIAGWNTERIKWAASTTLAVAQSWNDVTSAISPGLALVNSTNGTLISEGAGGCTPAGNRIQLTGGITADTGNSKVFFSYRDFNNPDTGLSAGISGVSITDATAPVSGFPQAVGGDNVSLDIMYRSGLIWTAIQPYATTYPTNNSYFRAWISNSGAPVVTYVSPVDSNRPFDFSYFAFDGTDFWILGHTNTGSIGNHVYLYKTNTLHSRHVAGSTPTIPWIDISPVGHYVIDAKTKKDIGRIIFDGKDLWFFGAHGVNGIRIQRLRNPWAR